MLSFLLLSFLSFSPRLTSAAFTCSSVGFFADPEFGCAKFHRCTDIFSNGSLQRYTFDCPAGTLFDDRLETCNWPWAVTCGEEEEVEELEEEEGPWTVSAGSVYQCAEPGIVKHETDCQRFWLCKERPEGSRMLEVKSQKGSNRLAM